MLDVTYNLIYGSNSYRNFCGKKLFRGVETASQILSRQAQKLVPLRRPVVTAFCRCAARLAYFNSRALPPEEVSTVNESSSSVCARE